MSHDLLEGVPLVRVVLHHADQEVLELIAEGGDLLVDLPEEVILLSGDQVEAGIFVGRGRFERLAPCDEHEEDNGRGEQVSSLSIVLPRLRGVLGAQELLRAHVSDSACDSFEHHLLLDASGMTEVGNPQLQLFVEQQVLRLQVQVDDLCLFVQVLHGGKQLLEVVARHRLGEGASVGDNVEHLAVLRVVHQQVADVRLVSLHGTTGDRTDTGQFDREDVFVLELASDLGLLFECGHGFLSVLALEYLAGIHLASGEVFDELDLGEGARSQIIDNSVFLINHCVVSRLDRVSVKSLVE